MPDTDTLLLAALFLLAAVLYSSVGHGGASGYLAAMAFVGLAPEAMRPTALALNVLVAGVGVVRYARAGQFHWRTFWPFVLLSAPAAFVGGLIHLPASLYRPVVGVILVLSALEMARSARRVAATEGAKAGRLVPPALGILLGGLVGMLAGLTGTGGGIFLSPILLFGGFATTRQASGVAAAFILVNSLAGLAGVAASVGTVPATLPLWMGAALVGAFIGTQLGTRWAPVAGLRWLLAAVLVVAGLKLILT